jgi:hypothetical protein
MFGTIISTDKKGELKINEKYFHLVPELLAVYNDKNLGGPAIKYLVNVYDRKSIFRLLPLDVRKEDVCFSIWGKKENSRLNSPVMLKAIELYTYVQYDPLEDEYHSIVNKSKQKMKVYNAMVITEDNISKVNKMESEIQKSTEGLEKLRERIQTNQEERQVMGNGVGEFSYIEEKLIQRQREMNG